MSTSPATERNNSPSRSSNRYSERYRALLIDSPARDCSLKSVEKLNSPLKVMSNETKIFEGEKYSSYEIKNEDRGEWRQSMTSIDKEVEQVEIKKPSTPPPPPPQSEKKKVQQPREKSLPRYMQSTSAYVNKAIPTKERRNILGPRTRGGITKRVGTSKIPQYQSTTNINAIEDIKSEMTSDDTYVSMAARIKLFEKGLGNGSNKRGRVTPHQSSSSSTTSSHNTATPTTTATTAKRDTNTTTTAISKSSVTTNKSTPNYLRKTLSSETKSNKRKINNDFQEKLSLWKGKEQMNNKEQNKRNVKRIKK